MSGKPSTSYDVARLAGVSQSAVSRVFSPSGSASKKTREKVLAAAKELGFAPNPIAKSLSLGRSQLAGLVVTHYAQQNYPVALKSAVDLMTETGDSLLIQLVDSSDLGDDAVAQLLVRRVDIILCAASLGQATAQACVEAQVPLVMINRPPPCVGVDCVSSPNAGIMQDVARLIQEGGAKRPAFLGGGETNWVSCERRRGFVEACHDLELENPILIDDDFTYDGGRAAVCSLDIIGENIDAVVAANDAMALGAIDVLRDEMGLKVPEEVQVVGHDDIEAGRFQSYRLTTVRQDMRAMFTKAIELAFDRRENIRRDDARITIANALIARGSTRNQS